jgi:hypothetical protein
MTIAARVVSVVAVPIEPACDLSVYACRNCAAVILRGDALSLDRFGETAEAMTAAALKRSKGAAPSLAQAYVNRLTPLARVRRPMTTGMANRTIGNCTMIPAMIASAKG